MENNVGIGTLKEFKQPVQKLLKSRYPELNLHDDSIFILPGFGSGHDGDYILVIGSAFNVHGIETVEGFDDLVDKGVEEGTLKKLANLFSPAIWTALGHEYHGPAEHMDKLFDPDYGDSLDEDDFTKEEED